MIYPSRVQPTLYAFSNGSRVMDRVRFGETVVDGCVVGGGVDGVVESGTTVIKKRENNDENLIQIQQ